MTVSRIQQFELQMQREIAENRAAEILAESPPALQEKINWIRTFLDDEWRRSIVGRYQLATLIKEIYDDVNDNNGAVYGAKAVEVIQHSFSWKQGFIYQALRVAETFTPEEIEEIAQMRLPDGQPVTLSHVVALSTVEDERQRGKLLQQTVNQGWTAKKLTNAVQQSSASSAGKRTIRRGRPLAKPKDFDDLVEQQEAFIQDFLSRNEEVWADNRHSLGALADNLSFDDMTQERADRLNKHHERMSLLAKIAQERADETHDIHSWFLRTLKNQRNQVKRISAPNPEVIAASG